MHLVDDFEVVGAPHARACEARLVPAPGREALARLQVVRLRGPVAWMRHSISIFTCSNRLGQMFPSKFHREELLLPFSPGASYESQ